MRSRATALSLAGLLLVGGAFAACGDDNDNGTAAGTTAAGGSSGTTGPGGGGSDAASCAEGKLQTAGRLSIAVDDPAFPPWVVDDDPTTGQGFEAAVGVAIADQLGIDQGSIDWVRVPFDNVIAPGDKDFDFALDQVSFSEERDQAVDFSDGYYDVNQAMVGPSDSAAVGATTVADLKDLKFGAQVGTTSLQFITDVIQPTQEPFVYDDNAAAKAALDAGQIDAIVLDLPTAFYVSSVEIEGTSVIGQFPTVGEQPEHFGAVFTEGNPLRDCVNTALDALKSSGELDSIQQEWLSDTVDAPVIAIDG